MSEPTVEDRARKLLKPHEFRVGQRRKDLGWIRVEQSAVDYWETVHIVADLLTKVNEAERAIASGREAVAEAGESVTKARAEVAEASKNLHKLDAAREHEDALIAGVREALEKLGLPYPGQSTYSPLNNAADWSRRASIARAILSRLIPSTPTEREADTITIPRPHVPFGPIGIAEGAADADYLRSAAKNLRYAERHGTGLFGANLTNTLVKLLEDAAAALEQIGENHAND